MYKSHDLNKDQTYFLNQLSSSQLERVIFPIGNLDKPEVRELAKKYGLSTAEKKDSTGVCFIGERNFRKFLSEYIPMKEGPIMDLNGKINTLEFQLTNANNQITDLNKAITTLTERVNALESPTEETPPVEEGGQETPTE